MAKKTKVKMDGVLNDGAAVANPEEVKSPAKKKKAKKVKQPDLEQYVRVPILAGRAPAMSNIFIGKEVWKVLYRDCAETEVNLWRLKQTGDGETIKIPLAQEVMIQKLYLEA